MNLLTVFLIGLAILFLAKEGFSFVSGSKKKKDDNGKMGMNKVKDSEIVEQCGRDILKVMQKKSKTTMESNPTSESLNLLLKDIEKFGSDNPNECVKEIEKIKNDVQKHPAMNKELEEENRAEKPNVVKVIPENLIYELGAQDIADPSSKIGTNTGDENARAGKRDYGDQSE